MKTKVKTFAGRLERVDKEVNEFIEDKEVVDVKSTYYADKGYHCQSILVIYKEK